MKVKERLEQIFRKVFDDESIIVTEEMTAEDLEDWDSLTHIQLIVEIEKEFNIKFSTSEIKIAKNVGEFIQLINEKVK